MGEKLLEQKEKINKIANTIRVKMGVINDSKICISELNLPKDILFYLQSYGYLTAQSLFKMSSEELKRITKHEEVLNRLHGIGIYYIWEDSDNVKKDNVVLINNIGLSEREKGALLRHNITTILELEIFIKTRQINNIKRCWKYTFK